MFLQRSVTDLHQVVGELATGQVQVEDGVSERIPDGNRSGTAVLHTPSPEYKTHARRRRHSRVHTYVSTSKLCDVG